MKLVKVVLNWSGLGEEGTMSWHLSPIETNPGPSDLTNLCTQIASHFASDTTPSFKTALLARLPQGQTATSVDAYYYPDDADPATAVGTKALSGWVGTAASNILPLQCAQVVSLLTNTSGRSYRGRQFWPAQGLTLDIQGQVSQTAMDALAAAAASGGSTVESQARSVLSSDTTRWGIYSRKLHTLTEITSMKIDSRLDIQRRRASSQTIERVTTYSA